MNKAVIIIVEIVVIAGAVFALKSFYNPPVEPTPTSTTSQTPSPQQIPTSQGTTPPAQVKPTPTPMPTPTPKPTVQPPTTSSSVLDRIEAAIRAKLKG